LNALLAREFGLHFLEVGVDDAVAVGLVCRGVIAFGKFVADLLDVETET